MRLDRFGMRVFGVALAAFILLAVANPGARAGELVMFETPYCTACKQFLREVAPSYRKSAWGRRLPLRRVNVDKSETGGLRLSSRIWITPTFVIARNGREVGRIRGYPGRKYFFSNLKQLLSQLYALR